MELEAMQEEDEDDFVEAGPQTTAAAKHAAPKQSTAAAPAKVH